MIQVLTFSFAIKFVWPCGNELVDVLHQMQPGCKSNVKYDCVDQNFYYSEQAGLVGSMAKCSHSFVSEWVVPQLSDSWIASCFIPIRRVSSTDLYRC